MSDFCHRCGPVKHEALTVLCAPCALQIESSERARERLISLIPLADAIGRLGPMPIFVSFGSLGGGRLR